MTDDNTTVEAVGKITEALETVERARGHFYSFHQLTGTADFQLGDAVDLLREAGHTEMADRLERDLAGLKQQRRTHGHPDHDAGPVRDAQFDQADFGQTG